MCVGFFVIVVVGFFFLAFLFIIFEGCVHVRVCMEKAHERVSNHLGKYCMA